VGVGLTVVVTKLSSPGPAPSPPPGVVYPSPGDTSSGGQGQTVDGIQCNAGEMLNFHVHAHLTILRNGKQVLVPPYIGIVDNTCLYWLHTHDDSGIIHMEAPTERTFNLRQLFDIWGYPLSATGVATYDVPNGDLTVFVDGKQWTGDPYDIELVSHTQVVIELGTVVPPPPYVFPAGD